MHYDNALSMVKTAFGDTEILEIFEAKYSMHPAWFLLLWPFYFLGNRRYIVAITERQIAFFRVNHFTHEIEAKDVFFVDDILHVNVERSWAGLTVNFFFKNDREIALKPVRLSQAARLKHSIQEWNTDTLMLSDQWMDHFSDWKQYTA